MPPNPLSARRTQEPDPTAPDSACAAYGPAALTAPCGLLRLDAAGRIESANATLCDWIGRPAAEVIGRLDLAGLLSPAGRLFWTTHLVPQLRLNGRLDEVSLSLPDREGGLRRCLVSARQTEAGGSALALFEAERRHVFEEDQAREVALAQTRAHWLAQIERMAEVGAWSWDPAQDRLQGSDRMFDILGLRPGPADGLDTLLDRLISEPLRGQLRTCLATPETLRQPLDLEAGIRTPDGALRQIRLFCEPLWARGRVERVQGVVCDITRAQEDRQRLWRMAHLDDLTGLANRHYFRSHLRAACAGAEPLALVLIDIEDFGAVNHRFGADRADAMLQEIGGRLAGLLPEGGFAARLVGDEFALLLPATDPDAAARGLGAAVAAALDVPLAVSGGAVRLRAAMGLAAFPEDGRAPEALFARAKEALSEVKRAGGGVDFLRGAMLARVGARRRAIACVRDAVQEDRIRVWYQPKLRLADGAPDGHEALVRIFDRAGQVSGPADWAEALEDPECATLLDAAVLRRVLADLRRPGSGCGAGPGQGQGPGLGSGHGLGRVAVNVSEHSLRRVDFAAYLLRALARAGVSPAQIELEIVETVLVDQRTPELVAGFARLRAAGVRIMLDDFGTGFASLSHLRDLPIDGLKIEKSFVLGLQADPRNAPILRAIVMLAQALGLRTVAEGVESAEVADLLRGLGFETAQGYHFGRPQPLREPLPDPVAEGGAAPLRQGVSD
ncbi:putative bifunctional diguanylate cyclase/phosphodiesterase [Rhodobacter capsulatus]|nr:EAL domain-containing protein [Rhodobacter capsulatus]